MKFRAKLHTFESPEEKMEVEQIILKKRGMESFEDHELLLSSEDFIDPKRQKIDDGEETPKFAESIWKAADVEFVYENSQKVIDAIKSINVNENTKTKTQAYME